MRLGPVYAGVPGGLVSIEQLKVAWQATRQLFFVVLVGRFGPVVSGWGREGCLTRPNQLYKSGSDLR